MPPLDDGAREVAGVAMATRLATTSARADREQRPEELPDRDVEASSGSTAAHVRRPKA